MNKWEKPTKVDDVAMAFGPRRISELLPDYNTEVPGDFKRSSNPWAHEVSMWFFKGVAKDHAIVPKEGIDVSEALRHLGSCLGSFEPKHEHKEAGCAYLMSLWFKQFGEAKE